MNKGYIVMRLLYAIAILFLLTYIIPSFLVGCRHGCPTQADACINNLRMIDSAKESWALANGKTNVDTIVAVEVDYYIKGGAPHCPSGGVYTYNLIGTPPTCTGTNPTPHRLPEVK